MPLHGSADVAQEQDRTRAYHPAPPQPRHGSPPVARLRRIIWRGASSVPRRWSSHRRVRRSGIRSTIRSISRSASRSSAGVIRSKARARSCSPALHAVSDGVRSSSSPSPSSTELASRTAPVATAWASSGAASGDGLGCASPASARSAGELRQVRGQDGPAAPEPLERALVGVDLVPATHEQRGAAARTSSRSPISTSVEGAHEVEHRGEVGSQALALSSRPKPRTLDRKAEPEPRLRRHDPGAAWIRPGRLHRRHDGGGSATRRHPPGPPRDTPRPSAADEPDVLLVLEQDAERRVDDLRRQARSPEGHQRSGPVERLGHAGQLGQVDLTQPLDERDHRARELRVHAREPRLDDGVLLVRRGVVDPVVQAAPLERVVDLARAVRGQDDPRGLLCLDGPDLRHRDLEVGQDLQQVRLELLVRPVDLIDEQHRGHAIGGLERLEQGAPDQEVGAEDVVGGGLRLAADSRRRISSIWRG